MKSIRIILTGMLIAAVTTIVHGSNNPATEESSICLGCHDFGPESPVHAVLAGSHGLSGDTAAMAGRRGCPDCHGASNDHAETPTEVSPGVSFGPRWTATAAAQDRQCLICHEENVARNWKHALHMVNNLTCVTCHDIHSWQDKVLFEDEQAEVCTICHKTQKLGIHGMKDMASRNPPCTSCHNPHDHESAEAEMLDNGSQGCRACHNPSGIPSIYRASQKANSYHKVMTQPDHTCLDCHQGIAHAATGSGPGAPTIAVTSKKITLFYPGMADSDWLLQQHPGSQPLRQGRDCQQCHRGEEAAMGVTQAGGFEPAFRHIRVSFARDADNLRVSLSWEGPASDVSIALMWGDGGSEAFRREGCFAACHSDPPGMSRERGEFVEMWRVQLHSETVEADTLPAGVTGQPTKLIKINKSYMDGRWQVTISRSLEDTEPQKAFTPEGRYTFGIALHGSSNPGARHWVSLPLTMSFSGNETDLMVEQRE